MPHHHDDSGAHITPRTKAQKKKAFLAALADGHSVASAARCAKLARTTVYHWRSQDDAFQMAWRDAYEAGTDQLEDEARRRAVDGIEKPVFRGGEIIGHVRDYSDTMLMFLLKARRPDVFAPGTSRTAGGKEGPRDKDQVKEQLRRKFARLTVSEETAGGD